MARKEKVSFDATHGLYHRFLGLDGNGRKPHFWLGADRAQAEQRAGRLELLWSQVEADWANLPLIGYYDWFRITVLKKPERPLWDAITLGAAKVIAKGGLTFPLPRHPSWSPYDYATHLVKMQRRFGAVQFVPDPAGEEFHATGVDLLRADAQADIAEAQNVLALVAGQAAGQTWHGGLDAYVAYLEKLPDESGWYRTQIKQCRRLKEHHPDMPLAQMGLSRVEEMINFWRHRPTIKDKRAAATTCSNQVTQLCMVLRWLDRNEQFRWQKPRGTEDLKRGVKELPEDGKVIEPFTPEELKVLWRYASPLVRLEILLALNCGFKYAEIASLRLNEIHLDTAYPGIVRHNRPEGTGSWVCRKRRKTKVYGEWKLWPVTAAGVGWALAHRKKPADGVTDFLLITRAGVPLDARTSGGNKSDKIYSSWRNLYRTVRKEHKDFRYLPFTSLEDTSADWIRSRFGWEAANLFTCHGKPVKQDHQLEAYSNKPFPLLFAALDELGKYLRPVFECVPEPWKGQGHNRTPPDVVARVRELRRQGVKLTDIAARVGLHWVTVGKICRQEVAR
jgi:integrase